MVLLVLILNSEVAHVSMTRVVDVTLEQVDDLTGVDRFLVEWIFPVPLTMAKVFE